MDIIKWYLVKGVYLEYLILQDYQKGMNWSVLTVDSLKKQWLETNQGKKQARPKGEISGQWEQ